MAARICLKHTKFLGIFSQRVLRNTFCIATASTEKASPDVSQEKVGKKKDLAKIAAYEEYRSNLKDLKHIFKAEYKNQKAKERRKVDEINQGIFSPYEQHKKAVEDIRKYNESKGTLRKNKEQQKEERMNFYIKRQKEASDAQKFERNREMVLKVIEESKSFVTYDNLEEKIQEVLSKETNYNFAITPDGTKILSKEPPNNLGIYGPGPLAYQATGVQLHKDQQKSWRTRRSLPSSSGADESLSSDSSDSSESDSDSSDDNSNDPER